MRDLIYFTPRILASIDTHLTNPGYAHADLFGLSGSINQHGVYWPLHLCSRAHKLTTPWPQAATVSAIPDYKSVDHKFSHLIDAMAQRLCELVLVNDLTPCLLWSGGIDSTAILVSLLRVGNTEFLSRLQVVLSPDSVKENAYFYNRFIKDKLTTVPVSEFEITELNYNKLIVLTGDAGNQVFGCSTIYDLFYRQPGLLNEPWHTVKDLAGLLPGRGDLAAKLVVESLPYAPFEIKSVYDLLWWSNFNFKWDEVLLRSMYFLAKHLSPKQSKEFYANNLFRLFEQPELQTWSMHNKDLRREQTKIHPKWHLMNYIHDFDHNDFWYANKQEAASGSAQTRATPIYKPTTVVGFDNQWTPVDLADSATRQELGALLGRI
jgi:hypothetical protein